MLPKWRNFAKSGHSGCQSVACQFIVPPNSTDIAASQKILLTSKAMNPGLDAKSIIS